MGLRDDRHGGNRECTGLPIVPDGVAVVLPVSRKVRTEPVTMLGFNASIPIPAEGLSETQLLRKLWAAILGRVSDDQVQHRY